ncbi:MAG: hypothetical protein SPI77_09575 [Corynebacterium sp.]|nr:hypothetical protein [Corynebacterium sp.]
MVNWLNSLTQALTGASLWVQVPVVLVVAVPIAGLIAEYGQRVIDFLGGRTYRWFNRYSG